MYKSKNKICYKVKFGTREELHKFNIWADSRNYDIDVKYNSKVLDGKSLIGLMGIDLSNPVIVILYTDKEYEFSERFCNIVLDRISL